MLDEFVLLPMSVFFEADRAKSIILQQEFTARWLTGIALKAGYWAPCEVDESFDACHVVSPSMWEGAFFCACLFRSFTPIASQSALPSHPPACPSGAVSQWAYELRMLRGGNGPLPAHLSGEATEGGVRYLNLAFARQSAHLRILSTKRVAENASLKRFI